MKISVLFAIVAVVAMTVAPAVFDGLRRFRWGHDDELSEMASRLHDFPETLAGWQTIADAEIFAAAVDQLQPAAYINRTYFNASRQKYVNLFLLLGPTGPTAVHTPDICFDSREYRILGDRRLVSLGSDSQYFATEFESRDANKNFLKSCYAWTVDGSWKAPEQPRFFFAESRFLLKIQVTAKYPDRPAMDNDPSLEQFLAELQRTLRSQIF
jgi:hypothetical protein